MFNLQYSQYYSYWLLLFNNNSYYSLESLSLLIFLYYFVRENICTPDHIILYENKFMFFSGLKHEEAIKVIKASIKSIKLIFRIVWFFFDLFQVPAPLVTVWLWVRYLAFLCLIFFIYKTGKDNGYVVEFFENSVRWSVRCLPGSLVELSFTAYAPSLFEFTRTRKIIWLRYQNVLQL